MMSKQQVAIIGCGWVGQALARKLLNKNIGVTATTTNPDKIDELTVLGCQARLLKLPLASFGSSTETNVEPSSKSSSEPSNQSISDNEWLADIDTMVICITPQFKQGSMAYPDHVTQLVNLAKQYRIERVILLSSTGIYQELAGQVDEQSALMLGSPKVALLHQAEQAVLMGISNACVLRLAGLVGPKRHPARFMAGKQAVANPRTPVNLVHQADVVNAIITMISHQQINGIFNVVSSNHPSREVFYQAACQQQKLTPPNFSDEQEQLLRIVSGEKYQQLGQQLLWPDLLAWLDSDSQ
ncbi:NAD(P)-binding domain-containing protein [Thalassotalea euphylliae]|nr:NAD(P)-binding domain-containing protein [Thalassotalea euphylliae]